MADLSFNDLMNLSADIQSDVIYVDQHCCRPRILTQVRILFFLKFFFFDFLMFSDML